MLAIFKRLFAHLQWADALVLESLPSAPQMSETLALYAHILAAEHVWLARLRQAVPRYSVWPALDLEQCRSLAAENAEAYHSFVTELDEESVKRGVSYTNSAGQSFHSGIDDILLHVALHGSYHRGQIASQVRRAGGRPAPTDYIGFVRGAPAATRAS